MVVSDPGLDPGRIVLVYMTTYEPYTDDACRLSPGDHPPISRETCIAYSDAREASDAQLGNLRAAGRLIDQDPVSAGVLARIREGVSRSKEIKYKYVEFLLDQGVID